MTLETPPADVAALLERIQQYIFGKRVRVKSFFEDFDPMRSYKVSKSRFLRCLDIATLPVTAEEMETIADAYRDAETGDVKWKQFVDDCDRVFRTTHLEMDPLTVPPAPGGILPPRFQPKDTGALETDVDSLLKRLALLVKTRGVVFKYCFQDFDKPHHNYTTGLHHGSCSETRFKRAFPFAKRFTEGEIDLLAQKFMDKRGDVNYLHIHDIITTNTFAFPPAPGTSLLTMRPDSRVWDQQSMEPELKIQALVVMNRIRIREFFQDFDKLRSGFVTRQQARAILDSSLGVKVPDADWEMLVDKYSRDDGMFCWVALCEGVDEAFTVKYLEKDPMRKVNLPDGKTTEPARRNRLSISPAEQELIDSLETDIRRKISQMRKAMKPVFQDFDRTKRGHVTKTQFARAMSMCGFQLNDDQTDLIALKYCNLGNHNEFDYREFVACVDPTEGFEEQRVKMSDESTYFDKRGTLIGTARGIRV